MVSRRKVISSPHRRPISPLPGAVLAARDMAPSAVVRQRSMADITFSWLRLTCQALARRHAAPWLRKISVIRTGERRLLGPPLDNSIGMPRLGNDCEKVHARFWVLARRGAPKVCTTLCWRGMDSNFQFRTRQVAVSRLRPSLGPIDYRRGGIIPAVVGLGKTNRAVSAARGAHSPPNEGAHAVGGASIAVGTPITGRPPHR